jgi:hypothetical protein
MLVEREAHRTGRGERERRLVQVTEAVRPVALAHERLLPASPGVATLLPDGGLRRGSTIAVTGSTSLALAVAAGPSAGGSWCVAIGAPALGLVAAEELGVALERFPLVAAPAKAWTRTVATALEAFDVVLAWPSRGVPAADARRLSALCRERGTVFVLCGPGRGHGRLRARRLEVVVGGRGAASAERRLALWLPAAGGSVVPAPDAPPGIEPEAVPAGYPRVHAAG